MAEILSMVPQKIVPRVVPVLLAGGSGSRLWPLSTPEKPKQFLAINGKETLFRQTLSRIFAAPEALNITTPVIIGNLLHRHLLEEQLAESSLQNAVLLLEPEGRNTAAAVAVAAHYIHALYPDALLLILPTDHAIDELAVFYEALAQGIKAASHDRIVTFGITPDHAATEYGYIHRGDKVENGNAHTIHAFVEKPDKQRAEHFLETGNYLWNAGIFLASAQQILAQYTHHQPHILRHTQEAVQNSIPKNNIIFLDPAAYSSCPSLPFDRAVMEKTTQGIVVPLDCGWNDLGSWEAVYNKSEKNILGNNVNSFVTCNNTANVYAYSESLPLKIENAHDMVLVASNDGILIRAKPCPSAAKMLPVERPWGFFTVRESSEGYCIKRLHVNPSGATSLQKHLNRAEHWSIISGTARVICDGMSWELSAGESRYIPCGAVHRLENIGREPLIVIEVQTGNILCENDIVRLDDRYGRVNC